MIVYIILFLFFLLCDKKDSMDSFHDVTMQNSGDEMSSGNSDQCPVCLMSLKEQLLGTPNNCPHVFCFECIQEWAKVRIQEILQSIFKIDKSKDPQRLCRQTI